MDGHSQAHMDVLAACPGKASPLLSVNSKEGSQSLPDKPAFLLLYSQACLFNQ